MPVQRELCPDCGASFYPVLMLKHREEPRKACLIRQSHNAANVEVTAASRAVREAGLKKAFEYHVCLSRTGLGTAFNTEKTSRADGTAYAKPALYYPKWLTELCSRLARWKNLGIADRVYLLKLAVETPAVHAVWMAAGTDCAVEVLWEIWKYPPKVLRG